jgi:putative transposase
MGSKGNGVRVEFLADRSAGVQTQNWAWSSYPAHVGATLSPPWLDTEGLHGYMLGRAPATVADRRRAAQRYADFVAAAPATTLWGQALRQQIFLGDEAFVERMQALADPQRAKAREIPQAQRQSSRTLDQWLAACDSREEALYQAYRESGIRMSAMARALGLSVSRVSRLITRAEQAKGKT